MACPLKSTLTCTIEKAQICPVLSLVRACGREGVSEDYSAFLHWESCWECVPPNKVISSSALPKHILK